MKRVSKTALLIGFACNGGDNDDTSPDYAGEACAAADECYDEVEPGTLQGEAFCLDRVEGGYCTHQCQSDADCCAVEGECRSDFPQVCSPFESTGMMMCFLSCESADIGTDCPANITTKQRSGSFSRSLLRLPLKNSGGSL